MPLYPPAGSGGGAPTDAQYLLLVANGSLSDERSLALAGHLSGSDAGAGAAYTITGLDSQNLLINGGFDIAQRVLPTAATAMTDDVYNHHDRWYSLVQGAGATATRIAGTDSSKYTAKLVSGGTTNRFGIAQVVESYASFPMQGRTIRFQCRVRANKNAGSGTIDLRCAVLEWTDSANIDIVTTDVVNDWTNGTFTTGNFFKSTTTTLVGTAQISANHNTWTDLAITGTVSSSCQNLVVFVWNEDVPAHASDFWEVGEAGLYDGATARAWVPRTISTEWLLCRRYFNSTYNTDIAPGTTGSPTAGYMVGMSVGTGNVQLTTVWQFPVSMFATPTIAMYNPYDGGTTDVWANSSGAGFIAGTANSGQIRIAVRANAAPVDATQYRIHITAESEL